jgi:hypothetical protein
VVNKKLYNDGQITFDNETWKRLRRMQKALLGISYVEIIEQAVRHALDEFEADIWKGY